MRIIAKKVAIAIFTTMNDNRHMKTFDEIEVHRPELAQGYLGLLSTQPGRPLALFAPRRVGKTFFLDHDLAPEAKKRGLLPIYADLWLYKSAPLEAMNHALEEALDDLLIPTSSIGKVTKTPVKKIEMFNAGIAFGDEPQRRELPNTPVLRLDALVARLAQHYNGKILLMLDEVQTLVDAVKGVDMIAALRAVLHHRRKDICAVFTGSSQEGLARLMNSAGTPMYQFAQIIDFPFLDDRFLRLLAEHFNKVHPGKELDLHELIAAFKKIGFKPALMKDIVKAMSAEGITDVRRGVENYMASGQQVAIWTAILNSLDAFEQGVLIAIAKGQAPLSQTTLKMLKDIPGARPTISRVRSTTEKLKRNGILSKNATGTEVDDPLFAEFLQTYQASTL